MRVLTKSRFKQALECPNKLYYTNKVEYANQRHENTFLDALANGGFQVEAMARLYYPDGFLIEGASNDYIGLAQKTEKLLMKENVVIYEAAFLFSNLFIRTDILVKNGNNIKLIEVKAKSFNPEDKYLLLNSKEKIRPSWKSYLYDVAFQKYVISSVYPDWKVSSFFMMADKSKKSSIDGLNQMFRITGKSKGRTSIVKKEGISPKDLGEPILSEVKIDSVIDMIYNGKDKALGALLFNDCIKLFSDCYSQDKYCCYPVSFSACKSCEYKASKEEKLKGLKDGFEECWSRQRNWTDYHFDKPKTFEIWDFRKGQELFENEDKIFIDQITKDDLSYKEDTLRLSRTHRQWLQVEKTQTNDGAYYLDEDGIVSEINEWSFPLHCIDFETSSVALPFSKGRKPYEQIAFQFSHHILHNDGKIEHKTQFIDAAPGKFPNFSFIRSLKDALEGDEGTIFRYAAHENSILNTIYDQLANSQEKDKYQLMDFIKTISTSRKDRVEKWKGERSMIDLCDVVKKYYYDPYTKGSNSIKAVLPAVLKASKYLKEKYSKPISELDINSLNLPKSHVWFLANEIGEVNPYKSLPDLFKGWTDEQIESNISGINDIADGGAALTAYGMLQYYEMTTLEREELIQALYKYCELDTLAMIMILEFFINKVQTRIN